MAGKKDRIEDVGERIGGARKDKARIHAADVAGWDGDLETLAVKDTLWPKPNYARMVEDGTSPETAARIKVARDMLPAKVRRMTVRGVGWDDLCRAYTACVLRVRDLVEGGASGADLREAMTRMCKEGFDGFEPNTVVCATLPSRGRYSALHWGGDKDSKVRELLSAGFPVKTKAAKRNPYLPVRLSAGRWGVRRGKRVVARCASLEEAEAWIADPPKVPVRPHLDDVVRRGPSVRDGHVRAEDFVEILGFRAVEFGEWVPQDERQRVLDEAWDAFHDLAHALGIEPRETSLGGTLALAFGSRGQGRAMAHYEPDRTVINLTRLRGAGSLAHEWGHAFDNVLARAWRAEGASHEPWLTGTRKAWWRAGGRSATFPMGPEVVVEAFEHVVEALRYGPQPVEESVGNCERALAERRRILDSYDHDDPRCEPDKARCLKTIADLEARIAGLRDGTVETPLGKSTYVRDAETITMGTSDYWANPHELFARAFEAWVEDRLAADGRVSQYLVQGTDGDPAKWEGCLGNPYPHGADRERIARAMETLARVYAADLAPVAPSVGATDDGPDADDTFLRFAA